MTLSPPMSAARPPAKAQAKQISAAGGAHTNPMPVTLHHVVVDAHDLPKLAQFWTQALGWEVLSEREREIVIGPDVNAQVGICFMPVTGPKTVKNRVHLDLTTSARTGTPKSSACSRS